MPNSPTALSAAARLAGRQPVFGMVQTLPSPIIAELAVLCGFDFVILDCEHGIIDEAAHLACLQVISANGALAAVRVRANDFDAIARYLDFGAGAILVPDVQGPEQAAALVRAATHGPLGTRSSTGNSRAARYGLGQAQDVQPPLLFALIESARAVESIDDILATPGLSGVIVGPNDLAADLGCGVDFSVKNYVDAFETIERSAARAGLLLGTKPHGTFTVSRLLQSGHHMIIAGADIVALREGMRAHLRAAREPGDGKAAVIL
jgi:4-hydroxy-2-oxoheptanedioate aldolase